jgi:hypothetical protein
MTQTSQKVTKLIEEWSSGDQTVPDNLMPLVYDELRRLAHQYMRREKPGHTMETSLVNEAYVRLVDQNNIYGPKRCMYSAELMKAFTISA